MNRNAYIGDVGGAAAVPIHPDARAYFERMTTPPTPAYREAFNWAVTRWAAIGVWKTLIKGLWILAADTSQAALLSAIGDTPRDAVIVGTTPTFTARKGFSGFQATKQVKFPITAAILASGDVYAFAALKALEKGGHKGPLIQSDGGTGYTFAGNFAWSAVGGGVTRTGIQVSGHTWPFIGSLMVGGSKSGVPILAGMQEVPAEQQASISLGGASSNYITEPDNNTALDRLCAYGFLDAAATTAQCRKFSAILSAMLEQLGAFD